MGNRKVKSLQFCVKCVMLYLVKYCTQRELLKSRRVCLRVIQGGINMTKAQQVRGRRLASIQNELNEETKKVFDIILALIDAGTNKGYYGATEVCLFYDQYELKTPGYLCNVYDLSTILHKFDRLQFFTSLKEIVEQEEGFKAVIKTDATVWDSKAIVFQVVVE